MLDVVVVLAGVVVGVDVVVLVRVVVVVVGVVVVWVFVGVGAWYFPTTITTVAPLLAVAFARGDCETTRPS